MYFALEWKVLCLEVQRLGRGRGRAGLSPAPRNNLQAPPHHHSSLDIKNCYIKFIHNQPARPHAVLEPRSPWVALLPLTVHGHLFAQSQLTLSHLPPPLPSYYGFTHIAPLPPLLHCRAITTVSPSSSPTHKLLLYHLMR